MMRYKPMLAHPIGCYDRVKPEDWPLYSQPKLDGVRCLIQYDNSQVTAYSRTGKEFKNIDHILFNLKPFFQLNPNIVLDGELYNHELKDDFEQIISMVRKTKPTDEHRCQSQELVQFHCYDVIGLDEFNYSNRHTFIQQNVPRNRFVHHVPKYRVDCEEEVEVNHEKCLEQGYEGSILRKDKPYECKRSFNLLKVKDFSDSEALILDWVEGLGKRKGTIGKFMVQDIDGNLFGMPVMDKFKYLQDNFEEMKTWVGKFATFTYFERTKAGSYRHPLFKAIRNYE